MSIKERLNAITSTLPEEVTLVAVSKTKPLADLMAAYNAGQRIFGENKIQEMAAKYDALPKDVKWHMIGHVQRNKVKQMAAFVHLIHSVDTFKLLKEIDRQAKKYCRTIDCLLQIKIASEDSKFGMTPQEAKELLTSKTFLALKHINIKGLMGMATFTNNSLQIKREFHFLKNVFNDLKSLTNQHCNLEVISMGMSNDYQLAIASGSTMVRVGSLIFGERSYSNTQNSKT